jgi:hypothetical protein
MEQIKSNTESQHSESKIDTWFSSIIDHIKVDHLLMSTDTATNDKKEFYNDLMNGETERIMGRMRDDSTQFFISHILKDYIDELKAINKQPLKLAMGLSDSKLLVWSEIEDDDDEMEDALLIAEAKVNGKYIKNGFFINSTIIEKSDNLPIPPHYQTLIS